MGELLLDLLEAAARHADYADARHVVMRRERLATRNGTLDELHSAESEGVGIRVRVGGAWGFVGVRGQRPGRLPHRTGSRARRRARAAGGDGGPLAPEPPARGSWTSPTERDPFSVPLEEKLAVLFAADAALRASPDVTLALARFEARSIHTIFASTEGAHCDQQFTECGGGIAAVAVAGDDSQTRSYPASEDGHVILAGYENFAGLELAERAPAVAEEASALLRAPACPAGRTSLILAGEQLGVQIHESIGHAVELDRVLGREISYAGGSFVAADDLGSLQFGSEHVNVTADATTPGGLGSFRWDDEGVEGRPVPIIRDGVLTGFLSSRETAAEIGLERSGGCARADGFARQPIVRMTNVNLEPGERRLARRPDRGHRATAC